MPAPPVVRLMDLPATVRRFASDRAKAAVWLSRRYGDVVRLPLPGKRICFVSSPAVAKHVLLDSYRNYKKSLDYRFLADLLGQGLITADGEEWLKARRTIQPLFAQRM